MWKHMARIISEVRPQYVFVENSPMLTIRGLGVVLGDLSEMGFNAEWGVISAADIGAPHLRERIWIVARNVGNTYLHGVSSTNDQQVLQRKSNWEEENFKQLERSSTSEKPSVANSNSRMHGRGRAIETSGNDSDRKFYNSESQQTTHDIWSETIGCSLICGEENVGETKSTRFSSCFKGQRERKSWRASIGSSQWWEIEPPLDRVVDGMADRVDRLKAIGNGQVPLCAATAWRILSDGFC
jgi:DNA (cytosine-5)-methyltransferase 1